MYTSHSGSPGILLEKRQVGDEGDIEGAVFVEHLGGNAEYVGKI